MNKTLFSQSGFTLVEVLVSITLLLMVIVGPLQIISHTNNSTAFATEQMTAWFLAQEGLELAQQARDGYLLEYFANPSVAQPWARFVDPSGTYGSCFAVAGCNITLNPSGVASVKPCGGTACDLKLNASQRMRYNDSKGIPTAPTFTRVVTMKVTGVDQGSGRGREVSATSTVTWRTGSLITGQKVVTATSLFNIYDTP